MSQQYIEVKPAFGRDYKNATAVKEDWEADKDFQMVDSGAYVNKSDLKANPLSPAGTIVNIRYKGLREICQVKV